MNTRLFVFLILLVLVICSAVGVVYVKHESRRLAVELGELEELRDVANAEWGRLQLEQAWLADASLIEQVARERLQMRQPEQIQIVVIKP